MGKVTTERPPIARCRGSYRCGSLFRPGRRTRDHKGHQASGRRESAGRFRFKIDDVFTITGRGTAVVEFIEQGVMRAGDRLQFIRGDGNSGPVIARRSVEFVDRARWRPDDPVPVGLIVASTR